MHVAQKTKTYTDMCVNEGVLNVIWMYETVEMTSVHVV